MPTSSIEFFVRDGLKCAVHVRPGQGMPILCLPGLTRNHRDFDHLLAQFPDRPIYRMDLRGRSHSDWDPQPNRYQPQTYLADVLAWLETHPEGVFDVVGTSLGGILTMALANISPQRIHRAVINDIGPVIESLGMDNIRDSADRQMQFPDWAAATAAVRLAQSPMHPRESDWDRVARALCRERDGRVVFDFDPALFGPVKGQAPVEPFWPLWEALADTLPW